MRRVVRRAVPRVRKPLPAWADAQARNEGLRQKEISDRLMREFDRAPPPVRHVEWAAGNLDVARALVRQGVTTLEAAEPAVRVLLERRWGRA